MVRAVALVLVVLVVLAGGAYVAAGRTAPPAITIDKPERLVGQSGTLDVTIDAPVSRLAAVSMALEQNGRSVPLYSLGTGGGGTEVTPNRLHVVRPFGKRAVPELQPGAARIVVTATRKSFLNLRTVSATATRDVQVRLEPPRIAVLSTKHYLNHGGSEMVVYRATPADVQSGVRVGDIEYPGFSAAGAGITGGDPSLKIAFFALLHEQDLRAPVVAFARDEAGNEAKTTFVDDVFEKPFRKSNIPLDEAFITRVVPEILEHSPELNVPPPAGGSAADMLPSFVKINGQLRKMNAGQIAAFAAKTAPTRYWSAPFVQLGNSKVEAAFADHRTYFFQGKQVDEQVHLGFDLAVTAHAPVAAANDGVVLNASWLGIYGNCVIIDHGLGVQSLYGHLMSFDVKPGDHVSRGQAIGRTDTTGLAAGDHLHFTMLVNGRMVNPVEWWDPHWIADRVERKLREAGAPAGSPAAAASPEPDRRQPAPRARAGHRRRR